MIRVFGAGVFLAATAAYFLFAADPGSETPTTVALLEDKKLETKPDDKKPEAKPDDKKPEAKPDDKKPEAKPDDKKPEAKPDDNKPEAKPEDPKPDGDKEEADDQSVEDRIAKDDKLLAAIVDAEFAKDIDLRNVGAAIAFRDVEGLTELGSTLSEAEKRVGRPHKTVPAEKLLQLAVKITSDSNDKEGLARLSEVATKLKKDKLVALIKNLQTIGAPSRAAAPTITIDPTGDIEGLLAFRNYVSEIERATLLADRESLQVVREGLDVGPELDPKLRAYVESLLTTALKSVPEKGSPLDETLQQLAAVSRGSGGSGNDNEDYNVKVTVPSTVYNKLPPLNKKIVTFCKNNWFRRVGNGQCAVLNDDAIEYATGRSFTAKGSPKPDDYVWGASVGTISPGSYSATVKNLKPGDLLQFRDYYQKTYYSGSAWFSKSAAHHSAIVMGVTYNPTKIHVYHQNTSGRLFVNHGIYRPADMKSGKIWAYRAK